MIPLSLLPHDEGSRIRRDRLELVIALLNAPGFDPLFRDDVIAMPPLHPVYAWRCTIDGCGRVRRVGTNDCHTHFRQWQAAKSEGTSRADFLFRATPLLAKTGIDWGTCHICPDRPSRRRGSQLCTAHYDSWRKHRNRRGDAADYDQWLVRQEPLPGYGNCLVSVCPGVAETPMGLCAPHRLSYYSQRQRKRDALRAAGEEPGSPDTQSDRNECFRRWCATEDPHYRIGVVNLVGLRPLPRAEMQWGLWAHTRTKMIIGEVTAGLRCVYYSPQDTKNAGFLETEHFGRRFPHTRSNYDLTAVPQRWLRDLLWEHLASILRSPECPRTRGPFDNLRRGCVEFGAFLEVDAPGGGHDPALLREEHGQRFAADLRHRARHGLASLGLKRTDGKPSTVTESVRGLVFNAVRRLLYGALESGEAARIGLDTGVIRSVPGGGGGGDQTGSTPVH